MASSSEERIEILLDHVAERIAFLRVLREDGRYEEALLLCCCYLEAFGQTAFPDIKSPRKRFVAVIETHGCNEYLSLVLPRQLFEWLQGRAAKLAGKLSSSLEITPSQARSKDELLRELGETLDPTEKRILSDHIWAGTIAAAVYEWIRNTSVHELFPRDGLFFSSTTFDGAPLPSIDLDLLYAELNSVFESLKAVSRKTGKLFGTMEVP
jgi:hypothetical protein